MAGEAQLRFSLTVRVMSFLTIRAKPSSPLVSVSPKINRDIR